MLTKKQIYWLEKNIASQNIRAPHLIDSSALVDKINKLCPELNCPVCNRAMYASNNGPTGYQLTIEHIIPVSKGGTNELANLFPLCGSCNSSKKDKLPEEWGDLGKKLIELNIQYHPEILSQKEILRFEEIPIGHYFWKREMTSRTDKKHSIGIRTDIVYEKVLPVVEDGTKYEIVEWRDDGGYLRAIRDSDKRQNWYPVLQSFKRPYVAEIIYKSKRFGNVKAGEQFKSYSGEYMKIPEVKRKKLFFFKHADYGCNAKRFDTRALTRFSPYHEVFVSVGELKNKVRTLTSHLVRVSDIPYGGLYTYWLDERLPTIIQQKIKPIEIDGYAYNHITFFSYGIATLDEPDEKDVTPSYITGDELINYIPQIQYWGRRVRFGDIQEGHTFFGVWPPPGGFWIKREGKASEVRTGKIVEIENDHRYIIFDIDERIQTITPLAETLSKLNSTVRRSAQRQEVGFGTIDVVEDNEEIDNLIRKVTSQSRYTKHNPIITQACKLKSGDKFEFVWRGKFYRGIAIGNTLLSNFDKECILFIDEKKAKAYLDGSVQIRIIERANNETD